ncbi:MAG: thioredoxin family protein, partial [Tannerellaceae bacterium]|nr:thioredoxin family protein [Tannerellaceae bacterium]
MERNLSTRLAAEGINICCYKVNGMACEDICMEHSISGFPSVLILKEGIEVNRILGVTSGRNLRHIYKKVK